MTQPFADFAPHYWAAGLPVIPLLHREKRPALIGWQQFGSRMPTPDEMDRWLQNYPNGNLGLPLGLKSGLCMIDIDTEDEELIAKIIDCLPPSPWVRVGKKGMALAYRFESQRNFKLKGEDGSMLVEFLGQGNQVVVPPSIHPDTGEPYTANANLWEVLDDVDYLGEDIEYKLRAHLYSDKATRRDQPSSPDDVVNKGGRHSHMTKELGRLRNMGYMGDDLLTMARALNEAKCSPPLPDDEIHSIVRSATDDWGGGDGLGFHDAGNAKRLVQEFAGNVVYVHEARQFMHWGGQIWRPDIDGNVQRLAKEVGAKLEATSGANKSRKKWANSSQSAARIDSMIKLSKSEPGVTISADRFDAKLNVLNTPTGVVDLSSGDLRPAEREEYFTKSTKIEFDPGAECSRWEAFVEEVLIDPDIVAFVQRLLGYIATGLTIEHKAVFASGSGRNGKSVLFNTAALALGDYAHTTRIETFMQRQNVSASNDLAALDGPRLVIANEGNRDQRLDTARVKGITGGDLIQARFLYQEYRTFEPRFTPVIVSNHMPEIDANDPAIWERLLIIPFRRFFREDERDKGLEQKLREELPGILNWIVRGAIQYHEVGLQTPHSIQSAVAEFRGEMDVIGAFITDCCVLSPHNECQAQVLYPQFVRYAQDMGVRVPSQTEFGRELTRRGIGSRKSGVTIRTGIGLKPPSLLGAAA